MWEPRIYARRAEISFKSQKKKINESAINQLNDTAHSRSCLMLLLSLTGDLKLPLTLLSFETASATANVRACVISSNICTLSQHLKKNLKKI